MDPSSSSQGFSRDFVHSELQPEQAQENRPQEQGPPFIPQDPTSSPTMAYGGGGEALNFSMFPSQNEVSGYLRSGLQQYTIAADEETSNSGFGTSLPSSSATGSRQIYPPPHLLPQRDAIATIPPPLLPMYSTSGIDLMSLLARVSTRPERTVELGPVDDSCAFCVSDIRAQDSPIIYCSKTFCELTGYPESEVLGKNCRFLQAPPSAPAVLKGQPRSHSTQSEIYRMATMLAANKECQGKIINYRKDGTQFMNLVTVIPIRGGALNSDDGTVSFHVGFQNDLSDVPNQILQGAQGGRWVGTGIVKGYEPFHRIIAGSYASVVGWVQPKPFIYDEAPLYWNRFIKSLLSCIDPGQSSDSTNTHNKNQDFDSPNRVLKNIQIQIPPQAISNELRSNSNWLRTLIPPVDGEGPDTIETLVDKFILEEGPDLIWVVSLKGVFLYVSPSVKRILGYEPEELAGKGLADIAHPKDIIPLLRELKESCVLTDSNTAAADDEESPTTTSSTPNTKNIPTAEITPRVIDLMFRAITKSQKYMWIHSRGRLYLEPGKGRKAIILSARGRDLADVDVDISLPPSRVRTGKGTGECWGTLSECGVVISVRGDRDSLFGSGMGDSIVGRRIWDILHCDSSENELKGSVMTINEMMRMWRINSSAPMVPHRIHVTLPIQGNGGEGVEGIATIYPVKSSCPGREDSYFEGDIGDNRNVEKLPQSVYVSTETNGIVSPPHIVFQIQIHVRPSSRPSPSSPSQLHTPISLYKQFSTERDSSWQYDLQQIKFANQRLREEIQSLEGVFGMGSIPSQSRAEQPQFGISPTSVLSTAAAVPGTVQIPTERQEERENASSSSSTHQQQQFGGGTTRFEQPIPEATYAKQYVPSVNSSSQSQQQGYSGHASGYGYPVPVSTHSSSVVRGEKRPWPGGPVDSGDDSHI